MSTDHYSTQHELRYDSQLFTIRLWCEQMGDHFEWRGKVQHVTTGEAHYFHDWETLLARLKDMLAADEV